VLLHVGTHRTGTTSIQRFLRDHPAELAEVGLTFPRGQFLADNHVELHMLTMRPERQTFARRMFPQPSPVTARTDALWSAEGLSFLRYPDEIERIVSMIGVPDRVVMFIREPASFLASYTRNLARVGVSPSSDPDSTAYVEPDSWLVDYDTRIGLWREMVGAERVTVLDYDDDVIPIFADLLGIDALPDLTPYRLNQGVRT
jgi:hypothetical protein